MSKGPNFATSNAAAGYMGSASIGGVQVRFSDANIAAKQEVEAPDLVMADWDRDAFNYGKVDISGSISGPFTEDFVAGGLLSWACARGTCGELTANDVDLAYYCGKDKSFTDLLVNSFSLSCAAGDAAQFSVDVIGRSTSTFGTGDPDFKTTSEKIITWDKVGVIATGPSGVADFKYSNFELTVANNVEPVYGIGFDSLLPLDLVPGLRNISGTLTAIGVADDFEGYDIWDDYTAANDGSVAFTLPGLAITVICKFHRVEPTLSSGLITSTVGFTGIGHQTGAPWS